MNQLKEKLSIIFDKYLEEFKEVNEYIYNNPELGHQEFKACEALTNLLKNITLKLVITMQEYLLLLSVNINLEMVELR